MEPQWSYKCNIKECGNYVFFEELAKLSFYNNEIVTYVTCYIYEKHRVLSTLRELL